MKDYDIKYDLKITHHNGKSLRKLFINSVLLKVIQIYNKMK